MGVDGVVGFGLRSGWLVVGLEAVRCAVSFVLFFSCRGNDTFPYRDGSGEYNTNLSH